MHGHVPSSIYLFLILTIGSPHYNTFFLVLLFHVHDITGLVTCAFSKVLSLQ